MDQNKIGNFIRELRKKNNLSQQAFADKLGVTFQAVSKWENGKNLPDMAILKEISEMFNINIDDIINGEHSDKKKNNNKKLIIGVILLIAILIFIIVLVVVLNNKDNAYEFNELNTTNNEFSISGSVVRTEDRTSLIINNVNYNGEEDNTVYSELSCYIYEEKNNSENLLSTCDDESNMTLKDYLENLKIKMDHKSNNCIMFVDNSIYIEIRVKDDNNKTVSYKLPLKIDENICN